MAAVEELASHDRCVAIGETGLDYFYDNAPRPTQIRIFEGHLSMAESLGLPVVVHAREAADDMARIVRSMAGRVTGVLHCFGGPDALLDAALESGWLVSFTGIVTFKSFDPALVRRVPGDRYMIETDSPYLAPVPHRGKRNEPALVPHVAAAIASMRNESVERVAQDSWDNATRFFGLPEGS